MSVAYRHESKGKEIGKETMIKEIRGHKGKQKWLLELMERNGSK